MPPKPGDKADWGNGGAAAAGGAPYKEEYTLKLPNFNGDATEARGWLPKFDLLAARYGWDADTKTNMISFHLQTEAETWFYTLDDATAADYALLRAAFEQKYVDNESTLDLEQKLSQLKLKPGDIIMDEEKDAIIEVRK